MPKTCLPACLLIFHKSSAVQKDTRSQLGRKANTSQSNYHIQMIWWCITNEWWYQLQSKTVKSCSSTLIHLHNCKTIAIEWKSMNLWILYVMYILYKIVYKSFFDQFKNVMNLHTYAYMYLLLDRRHINIIIAIHRGWLAGWHYKIHYVHILWLDGSTKCTTIVECGVELSWSKSLLSKRKLFEI